MSVRDLEAILVDAREGNARRSVTGVLVYVEGVFLQILEGEKETVLGLLRSIGNDSRHSELTVFHEVEVDAPMFGNWRMAYLSATQEQMAVWAGLDGTASIESILSEIGREPDRVSRVAKTLLEALAG